MVYDENFVEADMKTSSIYPGTKKVEAITFAKYPLLGNRELSNSIINQLCNATRTYINAVREMGGKLNNTQAMQATLALVQLAKRWDGEDSGFWIYIARQLGYAEDSDDIRTILCDAIKSALYTSGKKLFITKKNKRMYVSSIKVHAMAPQRAWLRFCDFLYDFYLVNMRCEYVPGDPLINRMVNSLRNKLMDNEDNDSDLNISDNVFTFQECVKKLIVNRPQYSAVLVDHMLCYMDKLINYQAEEAVDYVEKICQKWFRGKLATTVKGEERKTRAVKHRTLALDTQHINIQYQLQENTEAFLDIPDIRLEESSFSDLSYVVYHEQEKIYEEHNLPWYGNDMFGKTMIGKELGVGMLKDKYTAEDFHIAVQIYCDEKMVYDSHKLLYRDCLLFERQQEVKPARLGQGKYTLIVPGQSGPVLAGGEFEVYEDSWPATFFLELNEDFVLSIGNKLIATGDIQSDAVSARLLLPGFVDGVIYDYMGQEYNIALDKDDVHIILPAQESSYRYRLLVNGSDFNWQDQISSSAGAYVDYTLPLAVLPKGRTEIQFLDMSDGRVLSEKYLYICSSCQINYNRSYFFSSDDYRQANVNIKINGEKIGDIPVLSGRDSQEVKYDSGYLLLQHPVVRVYDGTGHIWDGTSVYWHKDLEKECWLYIKAPTGCRTEIKLGDSSLSIHKGKYDMAEKLLSIYEKNGDPDRIVSLVVSNSAGETREYTLARIAMQEQFMNKPHFDWQDGMLSWDAGNGFIGENEPQLHISVLHQGEVIKEYDVGIDDYILDCRCKIALGKYHYEVSALSRGLFSASGYMRVLAEGTLSIGDENELRFLHERITLCAVLAEKTGKQRNIEPSYIKDIKWLGIKQIPAEGGDCPVYEGTLCYPNGWIYSDRENGRKEKVNPVRIIFIRDGIISLTNDDGEGIYYRTLPDRITGEIKTILTDQPPQPHNEQYYKVGDLYIYTVGYKE